MKIEITHTSKENNTQKQGKTKANPYSLIDIFTKDFQLSGSGLNDKKKEAFYAELQILLRSGTDIRSAFEIVIAEQEKATQKELFQTVYQSILHGNSLSEALKQTGKFSDYEYFSIKIGEETGNIANVLKNLREYYKKRIKQRRSFINALTYPVMVVCTAILAIIFMLNFIVPMFEDVFKRFHGELPTLTQMVISLSKAVSNNIGIIGVIILLLVICFFLIRKKYWFKETISETALKLPVIGILLKKIYLARFCQSMAMLISSKTPMLTALQLVKQMLDFIPFEKALDKIEKDVFKGATLHQSMGYFPIFDKRIIALTKVGEEVNELDKIFTELAEQYSEEVEHQTGMLNNLLEPFMIIFVGGMVAVILIAMYLPLFQLSTSFIK